jgi:integrase
MASIRKLPSGSWNVQIRHKGSPSISKTFPSKKEATAFIRQFNSELTAQGKPLQPLFTSLPTHPIVEAKTTLASALNRYAKEITSQKRSAKTERYKIDIVSKHLGSMLMVELAPHHIAKYRDFRLKSVTNDTIRRELALLSHLFNTARIEWGWASFLHQNPVQLVKKPQPNKSRTRRISEDELKLILEQIPQGHPLAAIVELAYFTAMRRGEIVNIAWKDINLEAKVVYLPMTKNGDSRYCPLSTKALRVITEWYLENPTKKPEDKLFILKAGTVTHQFQDACEKAGLKDVRFHDLRHSATSNFIEQGLSIIEASAITGHKSMQMLKRYTHLNPTVLAEKLG